MRSEGETMKHMLKASCAALRLLHRAEHPGPVAGRPSEGAAIGFKFGQISKVHLHGGDVNKAQVKIRVNVPSRARHNAGAPNVCVYSEALISTVWLDRTAVLIYILSKLLYYA